VAQNRLARILFTGRGLPTDPVEGAAWHLLARAQGLADPLLDDFLNKLSKDDQAAAEKRAAARVGGKLPPHT
jgi:TPR repeat protein